METEVPFNSGYVYRADGTRCTVCMDNSISDLIAAESIDFITVDVQPTQATFVWVDTNMWFNASPKDYNAACKYIRGPFLIARVTTTREYVSIPDDEFKHILKAIPTNMSVWGGERFRTRDNVTTMPPSAYTHGTIYTLREVGCMNGHVQNEVLASEPCSIPKLAQLQNVCLKRPVDVS
jgi:hypothetical protein